jgi:hypothetical protein
VMTRNAPRQKAKMQGPLCIKLQLGTEINLPAMGDGKKLCNLLVDSDNGVLKFLQENDVAVYVAEHGCFGYLFSPVNQVTKQGGAKFISTNVPEMANLQFSGDLSGAVVFTEKKNFRTRIKFGPTGDGVALNYANMPFEGLGHSEQGKWRPAHVNKVGIGIGLLLRGGMFLTGFFTGDQLFQYGIKFVRELPIRVMGFKLTEIGDVTNVIASAGLLHVLPLQLATG